MRKKFKVCLPIFYIVCYFELIFYHCLRETELIIIKFQSITLILVQSQMNMHITPILRNLYWPPIPERIHIKVLLFVFNIRNGHCPTYRSELIESKVPSFRLQASTSSHDVLFPRKDVLRWQRSLCLRSQTLEQRLQSWNAQKYKEKLLINQHGKETKWVQGKNNYNKKEIARLPISKMLNPYTSFKTMLKTHSCKSL